MNEMDGLQRRMEDMKMQYAQDKETYRVQLVSTLLAAKKEQEQEQERLQQQQLLQQELYNYEQNENLLKLQEQKELLQKQIDQEIQQQRQVQLQRNQMSVTRMTAGQEPNPFIFTPTVVSSQSQAVLQPVPRMAFVNPMTNQIVTMQPQTQYVNVNGRVMAVTHSGNSKI